MFVWLIPGSYLENPPGSTSRPKAGAGRRRKAATPRRGESGKAGRINPPPISVLQIHASGIPPGGQRHPFAGKARSHKSLPPFFPNPQLLAPKHPKPGKRSKARRPSTKPPPHQLPQPLPPKKCQQSTPIPPSNSPKSTTPVPHYLACCRQSRYIAPNQGAGTPPKRRRIPSKTAHA